MVLLLDGLVQLARFGPVLSTKMAVYSTAALPWGLGAAGAEGVKQGVDSEDAEGVARLTAIMVKMGLVNLVRDIVVTLCHQERADAVAAVTARLLHLGELTSINEITSALVAGGYMSEASSVTGMLLKGGHPEILKIVREAGLDMGLLGGGGGNGNDNSEEQEGEGQEGGSLLQNIRDSAGQMFSSVTGETGSTPDAEALFSENWTKPIASPGKAPPSNGPDGDGEEEEPPKEERLL